MKKLLLLLLSLSFFACNSNSNKEISFFNGMAFNVNKGEKTIDITPDIVEAYSLSFAESENSIPLFRCVKGVGYTLYIGIPINTSLPRYIISETLALGSSEYPVLETSTDSLTYAFVRTKTDRGYITKYIKKHNTNLVYILATTETIAVSDSLLNYTQLTKRISLKE